MWRGTATETVHSSGSPEKKQEHLDKAMTKQGVKHLFRKVEGGGHAFGSESMKDNVAHSLRFIAAAFAGKDAVAEMKPKDAAPADASKEGKKDEK